MDHLTNPWWPLVGFRAAFNLHVAFIWRLVSSMRIPIEYLRVYGALLGPLTIVMH